MAWAGSWTGVPTIFPSGWQCPYTAATAKQQQRSARCGEVPQRRYSLPAGCRKHGSGDEEAARQLEGQTVFFLGDSMTGQHQTSFMCRLLLLGYSLSNETDTAWAPGWAHKLHAPMRSPKHCTPAARLTASITCRSFAAPQA